MAATLMYVVSAGDGFFFHRISNRNTILISSKSLMVAIILTLYDTETINHKNIIINKLKVTGVRLRYK